MPRSLPESGRYLKHVDGTPFFWLCDSSWEIVWKSRDEELPLYFGDRIDVRPVGAVTVGFIGLVRRRNRQSR